MTLQLAHDRQILGSSESPFWCTPQPLVQALFAEFPLTIDLAASAEDTICDHWLGPGSITNEDALAFDHWADFIPEYGYGFLNPPYSRKLKMSIEPWVDRAFLTAERGRGVVAVLPASIQTAWWQEFVWQEADEIRFFPYRISFDPPPGVEESGNANVNTAIVIWRPPRPFVGPWTPHVRYWSFR